MDSPMRNQLFRILITSAAAAALAGCMVGPNYHRPSLPLAPAFKEPGWTTAQPADLSPRGDWWTVFNDPVLNTLESKVAISNQNVAAAEAAYRQAEALVREQRAGLFPTVSLDGGATRSGGGRGSSGTVVTTGGTTTVVGGGGGGAVNSYRVSASASWAPDIWGRIRRGTEGARGAAQASEADLAAAKLSAQGSLATDYFELRESDIEIALLTQAVDGYQKSLTITQNRFNAGIAPHSDVLQAQSLLASTQGDLADLSRTRAIFEHAIAVLTGEAPETFAVTADPNWKPLIPGVPAAVPSTLLQRRPDVAGAERRAASASAQIGVQIAGYFPDLTLSGNYGFASSELGRLFSASNSSWSIGASVAQTLFDGGLTRARVSAARAAYDQAVATYRQTVLAALQDVEDQLAASRVYAQEYVYRDEAARDADLAATMVLNQYKEGQVAYTNVVTAQVSALNARRTLVQQAATRQSTEVALIQGLGGGWTAPF
ncbi:MAG: efflux transporter outer membrane subunit [Phenylobacterium sp.]|nr:MAG: efflux transporter outer membrane subunit [Phenylobacterium sp.]